MATIIQRIWSDNSDIPKLKKVLTKRTIDKDRENSKFDKDVIKDFVTDDNRKKFGHICSKCKHQKRCQLWKGKIICSCNSFQCFK